MSKYTTEVRFICESKSGLDVSEGFNSIDEIISKSWNKIFTTKVKFWSEEYRQFLCSKIIKHYYFREIGFETVGLWLAYMNERLEMIMPYYNQLYDSASLITDPFQDVNLTREHSKENNETSANTGTSSNSYNGTTTNNITSGNNSNSQRVYSETPQGGLSGVLDMTYLTNATVDSGSLNQHSNENSTNKNSNSGEFNDNKNITANENLSETVKGKQGGGSYSKMLNEYRDTFLNIDNMIIEEFVDLFMQLW